MNSTDPVLVEIYRHSQLSPWSYGLLCQRQRQVAHLVQSGGKGVLLVSEVSAAITLGRRTPAQDVLLSSVALAEQGVELYQSDRGGLATYHGPGQWILFPTDHLEVLTGDRRGVKQAVEKLLEIAFHVGRNYDRRVEIRTGCHLGVWTQKGKIASVGIHIDHGVLLHGLSFNGFQTPQSFQGLRPCGLDTPMDYLLHSSNDPDFVKLGQELIRETLQVFWGPKKLKDLPKQGLTGSLGQIITSQHT